MFQPLPELESISQRLYERFYQQVFDKRAFDIYIPPRGDVTPKNESTSMVDKLHGLIASEDIHSMLIIGDPGLGKTLLSYHLAHLYWQTFVADKKHTGKPVWLPVWLHLPSFSAVDRSEQLLPACWEGQYGLLKQEVDVVQTACQQQMISLLIIIDGLDEIRLPQESFYLSNGWFQPAWPNVKVITFSRPEAFSTLAVPIDYQRLFYTSDSRSLTVSNAFKELYLQPFSEEDIDRYLQEFVAKHPREVAGDEREDEQDWHDWKTYKQSLQRISPLAELAKNPFVLSILVQALPKIIQEAKENEGYVYTRERVYWVFVEDWLQRQAKRILSNQAHRDQLPPELKDKNAEQLTHCLWTYSENLARFAWNEGKGKLDTLLNEENTLRAELVHRTYGMPSYFPQEQLSEAALKIIRSGCLLECRGQVYRFLHKTIVEFFAARALFKGAQFAADSYLNNLDMLHVQESFSLNDNSLLSEPQIINMLADLVNVDERFKKLLYDIIEFSKQEAQVRTAAANAITILNVAGEIFNDKDFRGIQIPVANLRGAICDCTDFSGADLSGVCFERAWLRKAKFIDANLDKAKFGELPAIKHDKDFTSIAIDTKKYILFTGDTAGNITQWNLITGEKLLSWKADAYKWDIKLGKLVGFMAISALTLSPSGKRLAYATWDGAIHVSKIDGSKVKHVISNTTQAREAMHADIVENIHFIPNDENKIIFDAGRPYYKTKLQEQNLSLWDINKGICIESFKVCSCPFALSPEGKFLAYTEDNNLVVYSLEIKKNVYQQYIEGHVCKFSPSGKWLIIFQDKRLIFYEAGSWMAVKILESFPENTVISTLLAFTPDEKIILCEGNGNLNRGGSFGVWHIESGKFLYEIPCVAKTIPITHIPDTSPIIVSFPSESLPRVYCIRNHAIYTFEIDTVAKSIERKPRSIRPSKVQQGFLVENGQPTALPINIDEIGIDYSCKDGPSDDKKKSVNLKILKNNQDYWDIHFFCGSDLPGEVQRMLLSPNKHYLIFTLINSNIFEVMQNLPASNILSWLFGYMSDPSIHVFDLDHKRMFVFKHHNSIISMIFSSDNLWLVTAGRTVRIWELATEKCLHQYKQIEGWADAVALSQDKKWLAIVDGYRNLTIWNTATHVLAFEIKSMSKRVQELVFSVDGQYLACNSESEHRFFYQIRFEGNGELFLQLIERNSSFNIYCQNTDVNGCIFSSQTYIKLFQQLGANGSPSLTSSNANEGTEGRFVLENTIRYEKAIIDRQYYSMINPRLPITYDRWVISVLRDTQSNYPDHTFIIVEGVNAWGHLQLYRYDLATSVNGKAVQEGYAATSIQTFSGLSRENYQDTLLHTLLKANRAGRGLESIVGHAWTLSRSKCLLLHKAILADKESGLIPYSNLGNDSLLSQGKHNCYTWCRAHLIRLKENHIAKDLPQHTTDYIGAHPKLHLKMPPNQVNNQRQAECLVM